MKGWNGSESSDGRAVFKETTIMTYAGEQVLGADTHVNCDGSDTYVDCDFVDTDDYRDPDGDDGDDGGYDEWEDDGTTFRVYY